MPIKDEDCLQQFRDKFKCERCGRRTTVEPHHVTSRGFGGGMRLDVLLNLAALCRDCHQLHHDGKLPKGEIVAVVARREGLTPEQWWEAIWAMRREDHR